ncbi:hypothetical protein PF003_g6686 [Phytophthora fragariae]|nr:hypothetical protein PF003_g6686 [Phytophthora fragariae]
MHAMHVTNLLHISFASVARTPTPTSPPPVPSKTTYKAHRLARAPPCTQCTPRTCSSSPSLRGPDAGRQLHRRCTI